MYIDTFANLLKKKQQYNMKINATNLINKNFNRQNIYVIIEKKDQSIF